MTLYTEDNQVYGPIYGRKAVGKAEACVIPLTFQRARICIGTRDNPFYYTAY